MLTSPAPTRMLRPADAAFPARLAVADGASRVLYVMGNPRVLSETRVVAIVGARAASARGIARAQTIAAGLSGRAAVVSGGAIGIDAAAHLGALGTGGLTAAIVAGGVASPYPRRNHWLFDEILRGGGAVASPFADDEPLRRWSFLRRNETLAALADAVVVVEASLGSGSLHTARAAARLGRQVLACPGTAGTDALIHGGAAIAEDAGDVLDALAGRPRELDLRRPEGEAAAIWAALDDAHPLTIERLSEKSGLPLRAAIRALATLELDGLALAAPGGSYVRALRGGRV
jgi:DNA processing protein